MPNPLDCYFVYVDSTHRTSGTTGNFSFNVQLPNDNRFNRVVCLDCLIPKSFYLIDQGETFTLLEEETSVQVQLPPGNFTLQSFRTNLIAALNNSSPHGWTYNVTYPASNASDTGKWTYTVTNNTSQPSLIFGSILYEPFGFEPNSMNTFTNNTLTSSTVINLGAETRILLHSDMCLNPAVDDVLISINASNSIPFSTINFVNVAPAYTSHVLRTNKSSSFHFSISNEHNRSLNLNGLNMNFTLMFYREDNIFDVIKSTIAALFSSS